MGLRSLKVEPKGVKSNYFDKDLELFQSNFMYDY